MATIREYVDNTLNDSRFTEAPYETQLQIRQHLYESISAQDPEFGRLSMAKKQEFRAKFMTHLPPSLQRASESQDPADQEAVNYALKVSAGRPNSGGKSGLNFIDGWLSGIQRSQTLIGGAARLLINPINRLLTGESLKDREAIADSPIMQDARKYGEVVTGFYGENGMGDYKFGNILSRGLAGAGDMALMMSTYGAVGAPGFLTKWVPQVANAVTKGAKASTYLQYGLQAVTETLGFVGEDLAIDFMSGRFKEADSWDEWRSELGGDMLKGFAFFGAGELLGGLSSYAWRGAAKGITGLSAGQSLSNLKKLTSDETITALRSLVANDDKASYKILQQTARQFGGEDAVKELDRGYRRLNAFRKYGGLVVDDVEATKFVLSQEFDMEFDGLKITRYAGEKVDISFKDLDDLKIKVDELGIKFTNKNLAEGTKIFSDRSGQVELSATIRGKVKSLRLSAKNAVATFYPSGGVIDSARIETFVGDLAEGLKVTPVAKFNPGHAKVGEIFYPVTVKSKAEAKAFAESLDKQLAFNGIKSSSGRYKATAYLTDIRPSGGWSVAEVKELANVRTVEGIENGRWEMSFLDSDEIVDGTLDELGNLAQFRGSNIEELNKRLTQDFGLNLRVEAHGKVVMFDSKGDLVSEHRDLLSLWRTRPELMPKKPANIAPQFIEKSGPPQIEARVNTTSGDVDTVLDKLDKFENSWNAKLMEEKGFRRSTVNGNEVFILPESRTYHVKLGESGMTKDFDNIAEARKYMRKDMRRYENITEEFLDKFALEIRTTPTGHYIVYGDGIDPKTFSSIDDVKKYAADLQENLNGLKPLSGQTDAEDLVMGKEIGKQYEALKPELDKGRAKRTAKIRSGLSPTNWWNNHINSITRGVENLNLPKLSETYQNVLGRDRLYRAKITSFSNLVRNRMKGFDVKERSAMGQILGSEVDPGRWNEVAKRIGIELKPDMRSAMEQMRGTLDDLGVLFGIPSEKWLTNYLPRIKAVELADIRGQDLSDPKWVQRLLDPNHKMPDLDPFFEHLRVEDIYALKMEWDLEKIVNIYARIGYRKRFLGTPLRQLDETVRALDKAGDIPQGFRQRLDVFHKSMAGRFVDDRSASQYLTKMDRNVRLAERLGWKKGVELKDFTPEQLKVIERTLNRDISRGLSTLQTSALMSFKVWMPLRNVSQINHVGAIYSNPAVLRAVKKLTEAPEKYYKEALAKGYLQGKRMPGKEHFLAWLEGVNTYGTQWFKNSDDYTRIVAMATVQDAMEDGLAQLSKGKIDLEKFLKRTHAKALDTGTRDQFVKLLSQGQPAEASGVLERNIIDWTMYNYSSAQKPAFANHNLGKAMLSYSTYPIQFSEMFSRMVKNDPLVAVRLTANLTALSYFYNDVTGVEGYEGNPLKIITFMGGPVMTGGLDAIRVVQQGFGNVARLDTGIAGKMNRAGKIAFSSVEPIGRVLVPFNWYPKRFKVALEALDQGEYYTSLLQFSGLNVNTDAIFPNVDLEQIVSGLDDFGF